MGTSGRTLHFAVALIVMLGPGALGPAVSQQQTPATKVTTLLKEVVAELPGREIIMVTLDIPPGGGSAAHRHPGHHIFGYVLEGTYKLKLDQGAETILPDVPRGAGPTARRFSQCKPDRARQGSRLHRGRKRQADHRAGEAIASAVRRGRSPTRVAWWRRSTRSDAARSPVRPTRSGSTGVVRLARGTAATSS